MTAANPSPDVRGPRFLEPLPYASVSETANLRWIVRMLSLLMIGHAVSGIAWVVPMLGPSRVPLWEMAIRLPTVILFGAAAVLMILMRREVLVAVIAAYSYQMLLLVAAPVTLVFQRLNSSQGAASVGPYFWMMFVSGWFSLAITILQAIAIIAIIARCRKAGALD